MSLFLLTGLCFMVLFLLHHFLRGIFSLIEKAHEHLRESERRTSGVQLGKD